MTIQAPQPQDAPAIRRIAEQARVFSPNEIESVSDMLDAFFDPAPDDDQLFLVYRDHAQSIAGFACYGPIPFTDRTWELYWICVDSAQQRTRVGRALMQKVEKELRARNARAIYLETSDGEAYRAAREFYEREGFECVARIDDYYARGEGKMIYRKNS